MSGQTPGLRGSYRADAGTGYRCKYCDLQRRECNPDTAILTGGDAPEQLTIQDVTPNLFSILAVDAKAGPGDIRPLVLSTKDGHVFAYDSGFTRWRIVWMKFSHLLSMKLSKPPTMRSIKRKVILVPGGGRTPTRLPSADFEFPNIYCKSMTIKEMRAQISVALTGSATII